MKSAANGILLGAIISVLLLSAVLSLNYGSSEVGLLSLFTGEQAKTIILDIRLPRLINALCAGGLLALAGLILQLVLKNPLADPYILGVSGGGSVMALLALSFGIGGEFIVVASFAGAALTLLALFVLLGKLKTNFSFWIILSGVILAALWGAVIRFLLLLSPQEQVKGAMFWLTGDVATVNIPWWALVVLLSAALLLFLVSREMDVLTRDDNQALSLGINVYAFNWGLIFLSAVLTASAVSIGGNIGFVGLVVPHLIRMSGARRHFTLIPAVMLAGAALLISADMLARLMFAPLEVPVGIITTVIGAPLFIYLLIRNVRA